MKIVQLTAENVKRLVAVDITPAGDVVEVTGANGAGKTSVLDAIWWALAGAGPVQAQPIRDGAEQATIRLDLGDLIVTRTFDRTHPRTDGKTYTTSLTVASADGAQYRSPQHMLDELVGELSFDPLEFTRLRPREQYERLAALIPGIDLAEIEEANRADYERRRDINREAKRLQAQADGIEVPDGLPDLPVDEDALIERDRLVTRAGDLESQARRAHERIAELNAEIEQLQAQANGIEAEAAEIYERVSVDEGDGDLADELAKARETNQAIARRSQKAELLDEAGALAAESKTLTDQMEQRRAQVGEAVAAAELPVPGLGLGSGEVTLDGLPFEQASDAEQLATSVAVAMAANPQLRVIRVRDGSLLDPESMRLLAEMAGDNDFQVWVERVDPAGGAGVLIEDGQLAGMQSGPS